MSKKKKIAIIGNAGIGKSLAYELAKNKCGLPIVVDSEAKCCEEVKDFYLGTTCSKCKRPFRSEKKD